MRIFLFLNIFWMVGCVSATKQTDALLSSDLKSPSFVQIENVKFVEQEAGYCGPATLTMAMNWAGKNISVDQLAPQVMTKGMKGSLQTDMITASRRQGLIAIPIQGLPALIAEVSAGNPVIVFENLALKWIPQWHYAIVFGYDLKNEEVLMHSGPEAFKRWDIRKFERSWMLGDYWGLVVLPADRLSATASEVSHVKAASALEQLNFKQQAEQSYRKILERWPQSLSARIGFANVAFSNGRPEAAVKILDETVKDHPSSSVAWHNLAIAQGALQKNKPAQLSAKRAIHLATPQEKITYAQTLKAWLLKEY